MRALKLHELSLADRLADMAVDALIDEADLSPMGLSFYADNKRVHNDRIKQELGVTLIHPDYESGLAALLEQGDKP